MAKLKILLVDDEEKFCALMGVRIINWGYDFIEASSGKEALNILKSQNPDIIILDYMMPEMDGVATLKEIRQINEKIPVIMFTAYTDKAIKGAQELGVSAFIPKLSAYSDVQANLKSAIRIIEKKSVKKEQFIMAKQKILLVDDEPQLVGMVKFRLESCGYEVIPAYDGQEALNKARQEKPDLIILDLMLPKMDGYKVCGLLKADTRYNKIPIIMFTARVQETDKKISEEVGADAYITKPFEAEILLGKIKELLKE